MKIISKTLLIAMLVAAATCKAQPVETDLSREGLKGSVKTITVNRTEYTFIPKREQKTRTTFDRRGNIVEHLTYLSDSGNPDRVTIEYDSLGRAIELSYFNRFSGLYYTATNRYDDNGYPAGRVRYDEHGTIIGRDTYVYDNDGNMTEKEELHYSPWGVNRKLEKLTYDAAGNLTEKISCDGDGDVLEHAGYFDYNEQGDACKLVSYSESGEVKTEFEVRYKYDRQGNATSIQHYWVNGGLACKVIRKIEYY